MSECIWRELESFEFIMYECTSVSACVSASFVFESGLQFTNNNNNNNNNHNMQYRTEWHPTLQQLNYEIGRRKRSKNISAKHTAIQFYFLCIGNMFSRLNIFLIRFVQCAQVAGVFGCGNSLSSLLFHLFNVFFCSLLFFI